MAGGLPLPPLPNRGAARAEAGGPVRGDRPGGGGVLRPHPRVPERPLAPLDLSLPPPPTRRCAHAAAVAVKRFPPERIVCLTEETVETLYLLGQEDRIVGVSGYAVRPARVRREKPRVSAFTSADLPKILALEPDLVLTFSDLQAEIAAG